MSVHSIRIDSECGNEFPSEELEFISREYLYGHRESHSKMANHPTAVVGSNDLNRIISGFVPQQDTVLTQYKTREMAYYRALDSDSQMKPVKIFDMQPQVRSNPNVVNAFKWRKNNRTSLVACGDNLYAGVTDDMRKHPREYHYLCACCVPSSVPPSDDIIDTVTFGCHGNSQTHGYDTRSSHGLHNDLCHPPNHHGVARSYTPVLSYNTHLLNCIVGFGYYFTVHFDGISPSSSRFVCDHVTKSSLQSFNPSIYPKLSVCFNGDNVLLKGLLISETQLDNTVVYAVPYTPEEMCRVVSTVMSSSSCFDVVMNVNGETYCVGSDQLSVHSAAEVFEECMLLLIVDTGDSKASYDDMSTDITATTMKGVRSICAIIIVDDDEVKSFGAVFRCHLQYNAMTPDLPQRSFSFNFIIANGSYWFEAQFYNYTSQTSRTYNMYWARFVACNIFCCLQAFEFGATFFDIEALGECLCCLFCEDRRSHYMSANGMLMDGQFADNHDEEMSYRGTMDFLILDRAQTEINARVRGYLQAPQIELFQASQKYCNRIFDRKLRRLLRLSVQLQSIDVYFRIVLHSFSMHYSQYSHCATHNDGGDSSCAQLLLMIFGHNLCRLVCLGCNRENGESSTMDSSLAYWSQFLSYIEVSAGDTATSWGASNGETSYVDYFSIPRENGELVNYSTKPKEYGQHNACARCVVVSRKHEETTVCSVGTQHPLHREIALQTGFFVLFVCLVFILGGMLEHTVCIIMSHRLDILAPIAYNLVTFGNWYVRDSNVWNHQIALLHQCHLATSHHRVHHHILRDTRIHNLMCGFGLSHCDVLHEHWVCHCLTLGLMIGLILLLQCATRNHALRTTGLVISISSSATTPTTYEVTHVLSSAESPGLLVRRFDEFDPETRKFALPSHIIGWINDDLVLYTDNSVLIHVTEVHVEEGKRGVYNWKEEWGEYIRKDESNLQVSLRRVALTLLFGCWFVASCVSTWNGVISYICKTSYDRRYNVSAVGSATNTVAYTTNRMLCDGSCNDVRTYVGAKSYDLSCERFLCYDFSDFLKILWYRMDMLMRRYIMTYMKFVLGKRRSHMLSTDLKTSFGNALLMLQLAFSYGQLYYPARSTSQRCIFSVALLRRETLLVGNNISSAFYGTTLPYWRVRKLLQALACWFTTICNTTIIMLNYGEHIIAASIGYVRVVYVLLLTLFKFILYYRNNRYDFTRIDRWGVSHNFQFLVDYVGTDRYDMLSY